MMARRAVSNLLGLASLAVLATRPMHPYEIVSTLQDWNKDDSIKLRYSSVYTVVESLHRAGFVEPVGVARAGRRPERTVYGITAAGRAELQDWLRELISEPVKEYRTFEAALALLPVVEPHVVIELLGVRAGQLRHQLEGLRSLLATAAAQQLPGLFVVESEYRLALVEAELAYVDRLAQRIATDQIPHFPVQAWRDYLQPTTTEELAAEP
ncbi:MAG TPA: PadR family transcriptional regulator [Pseudonocardiaceae bacterium]